jgi:hypothetical protein
LLHARLDQLQFGPRRVGCAFGQHLIAFVTQRAPDALFEFGRGVFAQERILVAWVVTEAQDNLFGQDARYALIHSLLTQSLLIWSGGHQLPVDAGE